MRKYVIGFVSGVLFGAAVPAAAATIAGSGYLYGWEVTVNGRTLCYAPYVWTSTREIECD